MTDDSLTQVVFWGAVIVGSSVLIGLTLHAITKWYPLHTVNVIELETAGVVPCACIPVQ